MIPLLNQDLCMGLARAAHHPDNSFVHPKHQVVTALLPKNAKRIYRHRVKKKSLQQPMTATNPSSASLYPSRLESIAQEISLARDVAQELYEAKEISSDDWEASQQLLRVLSERLVQKTTSSRINK